MSCWVIQLPTSLSHSGPWLCFTVLDIVLLSQVSMYCHLWLHLCIVVSIRDRPFNLKAAGGGLWFFVSFRNVFFRITRELEYLLILSRKARIFFPKFNIRLYDKNSESVYFVFSSTKIRIFVSATLGIRIFFLEKNITPPFKLNGRSLNNNIVYFNYHIIFFILNKQKK